MEPDDWPYVVSITCHRHQSRSSSAVSYKTGVRVIDRVVLMQHQSGLRPVVFIEKPEDMLGFMGKNRGSRIFSSVPSACHSMTKWATILF